MSENEGGIVGGEARIRKSRGRSSQRGEHAISQDAERIGSASGTVMTAADRRRMIREEWTQSALPRPPEIPGHHTCWLTTTSSTDTIHRRLKLGYSLVRKEEVVDFEAENVQSGSNQYAGYVTCNEMVLGKIPMEIYQAAMEEFHHYGPLDEEAAIRSKVQTKTAEINQEAGVTVVRTIGGGFDTLGATQETAPPVFRG